MLSTPLITSIGKTDSFFHGASPSASINQWNPVLSDTRAVTCNISRVGSSVSDWVIQYQAFQKTSMEQEFIAILLAWLDAGRRTQNFFASFEDNPFLWTIPPTRMPLERNVKQAELIVRGWGKPSKIYDLDRDED